jgi:hypothetical protein
MTTAAKTYTRNIILAFSAYGLILFGVNSFMNASELPQWQMAILALLPMLPVLLVIKSVLVFAASWDELQRKKSTEAMIVAFFVTGFGTFAYGFLEGVGFPTMDTIWVMPLMMASYILGQLIVARRY